MRARAQRSWITRALARLGSSVIEFPTIRSIGSPDAAEVPVAFVPQPSGTARLVIYRPFHYYAPTQYLTLSLNERVIGTLGPNGAIYRDVPPGSYTITFTPTRPARNQFKAPRAKA